MPVPMALDGILLNSEFAGLRAITIPPAFLMALMPSLPSLPNPERIIPMAFLPQSAASELKKVLMVK